MQKVYQTNACALFQAKKQACQIGQKRSLEAAIQNTPIIRSLGGFSLGGAYQSDDVSNLRSSKIFPNQHEFAAVLAEAYIMASYERNSAL